MSTFNSFLVLYFLLALCSLRIANGTVASPSVSSPIESSPAIPQDCYQLLKNGYTTSDDYTIQPAGSEPFTVYCDQKTSGGGWTVFQRREDGFVNFYNDWVLYKSGFGDPEGEFWLGNDKLFHLTNQKSYSLRVDLTDFEGGKRYAEYKKFEVGNEASNYKLQTEGYSGDAGDAMSGANGYMFSTKDRDNDVWYKSCAQTYKGGWWYGRCHYANLNGLYLEGEHESYADGVNWDQWHGYHYSLKTTEMKVRPLAVDCYELSKRGETNSGVYTIQPGGSDPFDVFCDMKTEGGGWTVFQRRQDGSEDFYRGWADYKEGFGDLEGEFWLGNDRLFFLSNQQTYHLRVDLGRFENKKYAEYDKFEIADESNNYRLDLGGYTGDAGDAMTISNKMDFSTKDRDNDKWRYHSCASSLDGAWWYNLCSHGNLNGLYPDSPDYSINWKRVKSDFLMFTEMKLRPPSVELRKK